MKFFNCKVCFADHIDGQDYNYSLSINLLLSKLGISIIEKHVTLDRKKKGRDFFSAFEPIEINKFKNELLFLVKNLKTDTDVSLINYKLSKGEKKYRKDMKKYAVVYKDKFKNNLIKLEDIKFLRVKTGDFNLTQIDDLIKKKFKYKKNIHSGTILRKKDVIR